MGLPLNNPAVAYREDTDERVLFINQYSAPFMLPENDTDDTPEHLAELYFDDAESDYDFNSTILGELNTPPSVDLNKNYLQLRLLDVVERQAVTVAFYAETCYGIPLWQKSVSLTIGNEVWGVIRCISTFDYEVTMEAPDPQTIDNYSTITNTELATLLGTTLDEDITILDGGALFLYKYLDNKRLDATLSEGNITWYDINNLPAVDSSINDGDYYVVREVRFTFPSVNSPISWRCLIEVNTGSILRLEVGLYLATAMVFENDPMTTTGSSTVTVANADPTPPNNTFDLNPIRQSVTLNPNTLSAPNYNVDPNVLHQQLRGTYIKILDAITDVGDPALQAQPVGTPTSRPFTGEPPSQPSPYNFSYSFDTAEFSAVCAYYNGDRFFQMLVDLGFTFGSSNADFPNMPMPFPIDHWGNDLGGPPFYQSGVGAGALSTSSGFPLGVILSRVVNKNGQQPDNPNVTFLGNGTSYRMLLHELGHIFLMDRLNTGNFPFAHSFGDTLAAIISDPFNNLSPTPSSYDILTTFPWDFSGSFGSQEANRARRHGRYVSGTSATAGTAPFYIPSGGWYWGGYYDPQGANDTSYHGEQILSSTFYDAYNILRWVAVGFPHIMSEFASRLTVLLILKALKNLSPSGTPPFNNTPQLAMDFAEDIIAFDKGIQSNTPSSITWGNTSIPTGASHKVIRYAFERRGAYYFSPQVSPWTNYNPDAFPGPPVDIFIYKGGVMPGEYGQAPNFWSSPDIFNRNQADGSLTTPHQNPISNATNYMYLKVRSRGQAWPSHFVAKIYKCGPGGGNVWPNDWSSFSTPTEVVHAVSGTPSEILIGPFQWTAPATWAHVCVLATVSTIQLTSSGYNLTDVDQANTETILATIPDWHLIPLDNNIAQKNMVVLPGFAGSASLPAFISGVGFFVRNPYDIELEVTLSVKLPPILEDNGWELEFDNGNVIPIDSFDRDGIEVNMTFIEGDAFSRTDIENAEDRSIVITMVTEYGCIGGMTYYLDPDYDT